MLEYISLTFDSTFCREVLIIHLRQQNICRPLLSISSLYTSLVRIKYGWISSDLRLLYLILVLHNRQATYLIGK